MHWYRCNYYTVSHEKKNYMKALCVKLKMSCLMEIRTVWVDVFSVSRNDVAVIFRKRKKKKVLVLYMQCCCIHTLLKPNILV